MSAHRGELTCVQLASTPVVVSSRIAVGREFVFICSCIAEECTSKTDLRDRNEDWGMSDKVHASKESGGGME